MSEIDAVYGFFAAFAIAALLTPFTARFAVRVGAVDSPKDRGLAAGNTPLLGGIAIFFAVLIATLAFVDGSAVVTGRIQGILAGAAVITVVGGLDDRYDLHPAL